VRKRFIASSSGIRHLVGDEALDERAIALRDPSARRGRTSLVLSAGERLHDVDRQTR
jgi:hypothetical protein